MTRFTVPEELHSDRGSNLQSREMQAFAASVGMRLTSSCSYSPRSQGTVERAQKTITGILRRWHVEFPTVSWDTLLPAALLAYRVTIHSSVKHSPFFLLYGRDPRLPLGLQLPNHLAQPVTQKVVDDYADSIARDMSALWQSASDHNRQTQEKTRRHFGLRRAKLADIRLGDRVRLFHPNIGKNSGVPAYTGPYIVHHLSATGAIITRSHVCDNEDNCAGCTDSYLVGISRLSLWQKRPGQPRALPAAGPELDLELAELFGSLFVADPTASMPPAALLTFVSLGVLSAPPPNTLSSSY
jgi:hypothetical protein